MFIVLLKPGLPQTSVPILKARARVRPGGRYPLMQSVFPPATINSCITDCPGNCVHRVCFAADPDQSYAPIEVDV